MYPSGSWVGHWDQNGLGRQSMHDLTLRFHGSSITGEGWDCVGQFTLEGEWMDNSEVRIVKRYMGRHHVVYAGRHDGEGTLFGVWALAGDEGTFAMRPNLSRDSRDRPITELTPPADV